MRTTPAVVADTIVAGLLLGRVLDIDTGMPVAGAALWVRSITGVSPVDVVRSNVNGDFVIRNLPRGRWFIAVSKSGFTQTDRAGEELIMGAGGHVVDLVLFVMKNAAITGTITDEHGGPAAGIQVALLDGTARRPSRCATATTDDRGIYRFSSLRPGAYVVSPVSSPGDLACIDGSRTIHLARGREQSGVDFGVASTDGTARDVAPHGAVITGRVTDENGDPLSVTVQVLTHCADTGDLIAVPAARPTEARTDDRGIYRIHGLPRGKYYIGVTHGMIGAGTAGHETTAADVQWARAQIAGRASATTPNASTITDPIGQGPLTVYAPTFHPSAVTLGDAVPIWVDQDEERAGVEVVVRLVRGVTLAGTVVTPDGSIPSSVLLSLSPDRPYVPSSNILSSGASGTAWSLGGLVTPPVTASGQFTIRSLTPGTYILSAQGTARLPDDVTRGGAGTRMWARKTVILGEHDVADLVVILQAVTTVCPTPGGRGTGALGPTLAAVGASRR